MKKYFNDELVKIIELEQEKEKQEQEYNSNVDVLTKTIRDIEASIDDAMSRGDDILYMQMQGKLAITKGRLLNIVNTPFCMENADRLNDIKRDLITKHDELLRSRAEHIRALGREIISIINEMETIHDEYSGVTSKHKNIRGVNADYDFGFSIGSDIAHFKKYAISCISPTTENASSCNQSIFAFSYRF